MEVLLQDLYKIGVVGRLLEIQLFLLLHFELPSLGTETKWLFAGLNLSSAANTALCGAEISMFWACFF